MGRFSATRSLLLSAVFGVILPSFDVYSDVYLMHNTLNFVGDDLQSIGCKACFGKSEEEVYSKKVGVCTMCTTQGDNYYNEGGIICGGYISAMKKMLEIKEI